jgi:hypothetical protein
MLAADRRMGSIMANVGSKCALIKDFSHVANSMLSSKIFHIPGFIICL